MTRPTRFTKAEIENAARVCRSHNVIVKLARDGSLLLFPDLHKTPKVDTTLDEELDAELAAFEAEHGRVEAKGYL